MKKIYQKHPKKLLSLLGLAIAGIAFGFNGFIFQNKQDLSVKLSNFKPGTEVEYRVTSGNTVIANDKKVVSKNGQLSLPVSAEDILDKASDKLRYELSMNGIDLDEKDITDKVRIMFDLDKETGETSISASGLDEYTDVLVENQGKKQSLNADWAGLFNAKLQKQDNAPSDRSKELKLAFQNAGVTGDLDALGQGEIEAFFGFLGDNDGSDLAAVQSRWSWALVTMTRELSSVMVLQTEIIGMFFDARIQLATQRKHQELQARAHKDYHPSDQMCRIGTFMKSVAHSESKADREKRVLNKYFMEQYTGVESTITAQGHTAFERVKLAEYIAHNCDTKDNGGSVEVICAPIAGGTTAEELERKNKDIDYSRALMLPLTLDIDFADSVLSDEEEDILALGRHLYVSSSFPNPSPENLAADTRPHYDSRSYAAKMNVAHNSFINIVGMKSSAPEGTPTTATATAPPPPAFGQVPPPTARTAPTVLPEDSGWAYMKALIREEFGVTNLDEIDEILGERPSYYAQMEVLTKKIYQTPNFYTNLYDKPNNVKRIGASLDAIMLMNQRDRYESLLRREMLSAVLLEDALQPQVEEINASMYEAMQKSQLERR